MHYIRLLRPPNVVKASRPGQASALALVLTITTDLGESFLCPDAPISIAVEVVVDAVQDDKRDEDGEDDEAKDDGDDAEAEPPKTVVTHVFDLPVTAPVTAGKAKPGKPPKPTTGSGDGLSWKAGMRVLKLEAKLPKAAEACLWDTATVKRRIRIRPAGRTLSAVHARQLVGSRDGNGGLIMPLWVDVPDSASDGAFEHVALRRLAFDYNKDESTAAVEVEEEIGESIARHVWDAGLVAVAYLADMCLAHTPSRKRPREEEDEEAEVKPQSFHDVLRRTLLSRPKGLRVLELGSGVGILGIGLAAIVHEAEQASTSTEPSKNTFLLTDLPEAEERARANMARSAHLSLDYENLDWEDGREGRFGPAVTGAHGSNWDLVVLSDCTYNVDMLPALVETLSALADVPSSDLKKKPGVLLARKPRHASEEALFTLMKEHGWTVRASSTVPLPVLDNDAEIVELYLYEKA
ncbi:hypothetical protein Sste5346_009833 [Sporothrix stenoceras]|uniref:Uncharacterized protein n=1 Tax=Sporothrix stenoceras TaxID=5173 RepID=A0ABR3YI80_9PEZI